jgi:hypothetical protein
VEQDLNGLFDHIRNSVASDQYHARPMRVVNIPKPGWHVRPGSFLHVIDQLLFHALLHDCHQAIYKAISWSQNSTRFSHTLDKVSKARYWFIGEATGWSDFRSASLELLDTGKYSHVVLADISAYFENIELGILVTELKRIGAPNDTINVLSSLLNRWAEPRMRGIPQGSRPSSILGELYLDTLDRLLNRDGSKHHRYMDDIRIFSTTAHEARRSLTALTEVLRDRGLNLQTAKTQILDIERARSEIDGVGQIIAGLETAIWDEIEEDVKASMDAEGYEMTDSTFSAISQLKESMDDTVKIAAVQRAFQEYFVDKENGFDKTLFHYTLNRLGVAGDATAFEYCMECLSSYPEETRAILGYFERLGPDQIKNAVPQLAALCTDPQVVHEYQRFLVLRWLYRYAEKDDNILNAARKISKGNFPDYLKNYAYAIIGKWGDHADLERLASSYAELPNEEARATVICSIARLERQRRNTLFARASGESGLTDRAIARAKAL